MRKSCYFNADGLFGRDKGLHVSMPTEKPCEHAFSIRIVTETSLNQSAMVEKIKATRKAMEEAKAEPMEKMKSNVFYEPEIRTLEMEYET